MGHMSYFTVPDPFKKDLAELTAVACMLADHGYRVMAAGRDAGRTEKLREYSPGEEIHNVVFYRLASGREPVRE